MIILKNDFKGSFQGTNKKEEEIVDARTKKATYLQKGKYPALKQHPEWVKR